MNPGTDLFSRRRAGLLLHPTSLPGPGPTGVLGREARRFVDFLSAGGFTVWQTLPLGPTDQYGSPYCLQSAYAGHVGLVDRRDFDDGVFLPREFEGDALGRSSIDAYRSFARNATPEQKSRFGRFLIRNRRWLFPYGLFCLCRRRFGFERWWQWPEPYRDRDSSVMRSLFARSIEQFRAMAFEQYLFDQQWTSLRHYANDRGLYLFGDMPFYMDRDSVEVWWSRELFSVNAVGALEVMSGVPPDYFNEEGQLWGSPLYRWDRIEADGFRWWVDRVSHQLDRFDLVRIDHFRALESFWEVPVGATTAREGRWRPGVGDRLLQALRDRLGRLPFVAEDLGIITDEVRRLREKFDLPGMAVLQFGFDGSRENPHLLQNHQVRSVVYTGTHDNDTTLGWYRSLDPGVRAEVSRTLGCREDAVPVSLIEAAYASRARLAVLPLQDLLGLGSEARMNRPGTVDGNWSWRFDLEDLDPAVAARARDLARRSGRIID